MRAILSVFDKTGIIDFGKGLQAQGVELFSTGGTKKALEGAGVAIRAVEELTGFPEMLDGRVKTLHPAVHGGILFRRDLPDHQEQMKKRGFQGIDLVAVNLYPFTQTVAKAGVSLEDALENIDIGGPTMLRSSAKNFPDVLVVCDPADYSLILETLKKGSVSLEERQRLAYKAFQHTASYDTAIAQYLGKETFPETMTISLRKLSSLRYGENPHQSAAFYEEVRSSQPAWGMASVRQLWGKELSFNNYLDADAAWGAASDFAEPTVAIIKHTNPCGLASRGDLAEAYRLALAGDPVSAFGGIVAVNRKVTLTAATEIAQTFYEIVIAPGYDDAALQLLKSKRDLRILEVSTETPPSLDVRRVRGGFLVQTPDFLPEDPPAMKVVSKRRPTAEEEAELRFAWRAVKHVKSNAIVITKDNALLGMGAGQPNRVTSVQLALQKAGEASRGAVLGSDAFFPFPDGVEAAARGGVRAIIEPGGSVRDQECIKVADEHNMAMVFTGVRHFKH